MTTFHGTRDVGVRHATHVMVSSPVGSCFDGRTGIVVRTVDDTVFVRLRDHGREVTLPFGRSELVLR